MQYWHSTLGDDVLADTHKGPCVVYLARSDSGEGNVWFKVFEKGYDAATKKWCTEDIIANNGRISGVTIPSDLLPGNYLLRAELIALHDANKPHGAQPYVHCAELAITGSGTANPSATQGVAIPGIYTEDNMRFDLYQPYSSYIVPGPAVYKSALKPSTSATVITPTTRTSTSTTTRQQLLLSSRQLCPLHLSHPPAGAAAAAHAASASHNLCQTHGMRGPPWSPSTGSSYQMAGLLLLMYAFSWSIPIS